MATRRLGRRTASGSDGQQIACRSRGSLTEAFEAGVKGSEPCFPVPLDFFKILGMGVSASTGPTATQAGFGGMAHMSPKPGFARHWGGHRLGGRTHA